MSGRRLARSPAWSRGKSVLTVRPMARSSRRQLEEGIGLGQLVAHREQDQLLALGPVEVGLRPSIVPSGISIQPLRLRA